MQKKYAKRNIRLYVFVKVFAKRVFLPLSAIYFVQEAGFTIQEIGILASFFFLVSFLAEVPTGYFADKFTRTASIRLAACLNIISTLIYVFYPVKWAIFTAQFIEAVGYGFLMGAGEALVHDSLDNLGKQQDYSKVLSRAQAVSLLINAGLITLITMTYAIDPRLPFLCGTIAYTGLLIVGLMMKDVRHRRSLAKQRKKKFRFPNFITKQVLLFGLLYGLVGALSTAPSDSINLALKDFGLRPELLGWLFGAASVIGAVVGTQIHLLKNMKVHNFALLDGILMVIPFAAALTKNFYVLGLAFIINMVFWRYKRIIYQDHLLKRFPTNYKATLISAANNAEQLNLIWLPIVITASIGLFSSYALGLGIFGAFGILITPYYVVVVRKLFKTQVSS